MSVSKPSTVPYSSRTTATRDRGLLEHLQDLQPARPFVDEERQRQSPLDPKRLDVLVLTKQVLDLDDSQQVVEALVTDGESACGGWR